MTRGLTAGMVTEATADTVAPIVLIKAEFDSGSVFLFTGYGTITFNGDDYTGAGNVLSFSSIEETQELEANNVTATLSGVNTALIAIALAEEYQDRPVTMWLAFLNQATGAIIADPTVIFRGRLDVMTIEESGETASISMRAESVLISLKRPKTRRYTSEDQKITDPTDTFFDRVPALQDTQVIWGRG